MCPGSESGNNGEDEEGWTSQLVAGENVAGTLSLVLRGLEKFTEYEVRVQAFNNKGRGPNSTQIVGTTREDGIYYYDYYCSHILSLSTLHHAP